MPSRRVLICGAGIAGSVSAYWLGKFGFQVLVVERSKASQKAGQGLEIEEPALTVVRHMGIMDALQQRKTGELGFQLVDEKARLRAHLDVGGFSATGELELMRGDLTEILYHAADEFANVEYEFETTVRSLTQTGEKVIAELARRGDDTSRTEEFDFVIGADGVKSQTRQMAMGSPEELDCFKPVGAYVAYFSIPKEEHDWPYSKLCHFPGRKVLWFRPMGKDSKTTSVHMIHINKDIPALTQANAEGNRQKQKEAFAEIYKGLGWECPRAVEQMMKAENFYSDELAQVKLSKWSANRVVLLGDSAWAPTPFTGQGNQLAIIGSWVLAQEMARDPTPTAFETYESRFRAYVEKCQEIPAYGYGPRLFVPETAWGIWVFRTFIATLASVFRLFVACGFKDRIPDGLELDFDLQIEGQETEMVK